MEIQIPIPEITLVLILQGVMIVNSLAGWVTHYYNMQKAHIFNKLDDCERNGLKVSVSMMLSLFIFRVVLGPLSKAVLYIVVAIVNIVVLVVGEFVVFVFRFISQVVIFEKVNLAPKIDWWLRSSESWTWNPFGTMSAREISANPKNNSDDVVVAFIIVVLVAMVVGYVALFWKMDSVVTYWGG